MSSNKTQEIEDRLIDFSVRIIKLVEALPNTLAGRHIGQQLLRSGTSPAPNYGEARGAESKADFIHKLISSPHLSTKASNFVRLSMLPPPLAEAIDK